MTVVIEVDASCTACGACVMTCPEQALVRTPGRPTGIAGRCSACMACIEVCPRDSIAVDGRP